jgi:serine phosphatase RsbU (regulator of sigma subunit)
MVKVAFAAEAGRLDEPGLALTNINHTLCGTFAGAYVTACCAVIDTFNHRLSYSNAGHPAPLLRRRDGRVEHLDERGLLLAFDAEAQYATAEVALNAGDRLVLFSDGLVEARSASDEFLGEARLEQCLVANALATPEQLIDEIVASLRRWVGSQTHLQDDVTIVVVDVGDLTAVA